MGERRGMLGVASTVLAVGGNVVEPPEAPARPTSEPASAPTLAADERDARTLVAPAKAGSEAAMLLAPAKDSAPAASVPPREQARYRPRGVLGEGGMGRVELVWDATYPTLRWIAIRRRTVRRHVHD